MYRVRGYANWNNNVMADRTAICGGDIGSTDLCGTLCDRGIKQWDLKVR